MSSVARLLRVQLIRPRHYCVVKAVGAATAALASGACFGHASLPALASAAVAAGLALGATDSVFQMLIVRRARRRAQSGGCVHCGYSLPGRSSLNCPGCGAPLVARRVRVDRAAGGAAMGYCGAGA